MWLEKLIIKQAEKKLLPYRTNAKSFKQEKAAEFQHYLPQISALYTQTTHWHGTGRYHYQHSDDSRYKNINDDTLIDILDAILGSGGLKTYIDPWINSGDKTVSLATVRMHARVFALVHTYEKNTLSYELGSIKFWLRLYFLLLFVWLFSNFWSQRIFIKSLFRRSFFKDIQNYSNTIRKPTGEKTGSIFDIFRSEIPVSNIEGNYPILIGLCIESTDLIETIPLTHKVEQRSLKPITLTQFTHIEVPLEKVFETERMLKNRNLSLLVIPIEFTDVYLADLSLEKLAYS